VGEKTGTNSRGFSSRNLKTTKVVFEPDFPPTDQTSLLSSRINAQVLFRPPLLARRNVASRRDGTGAGPNHTGGARNRHVRGDRSGRDARGGHGVLGRLPQQVGSWESGQWIWAEGCIPARREERGALAGRPDGLGRRRGVLQVHPRIHLQCRGTRRLHVSTRPDRSVRQCEGRPRHGRCVARPSARLARRPVADGGPPPVGNQSRPARCTSRLERDAAVRQGGWFQIFRHRRRRNRRGSNPRPSERPGGLLPVACECPTHVRGRRCGKAVPGGMGRVRRSGPEPTRRPVRARV
jgi:hypothetical protein